MDEKQVFNEQMKKLEESIWALKEATKSIENALAALLAIDLNDFKLGEN